jgi:hypothetical protein
MCVSSTCTGRTVVRLGRILGGTRSVLLLLLLLLVAEHLVEEAELGRDERREP